VKAGNTTANYLLGSEVVYQVTLSQSQCAIHEFLDGQELGKTVQATLKAAFTHHLMSLPPYENRRFERLYHQIADSFSVFVMDDVEANLKEVSRLFRESSQQALVSL